MGFNNWIFSNYQNTDEVTILELGCGTGELWKSNLDSIDKMKQLIITDFSNDMVETTKSVIGNRDNVNYERMDIQNISFENETFDIIFNPVSNVYIEDLENMYKRSLSSIEKGWIVNGWIYESLDIHV